MSFYECVKVLLKSLGVVFPAAHGIDKINYLSNTSLLAAGHSFIVFNLLTNK